MGSALVAGGWGAVAGSALLIGAVTGTLVDVPRRLTAAIMAFGAGVLIAALSLDLMEEAFHTGGFDSAAAGFIGGALLFTIINWMLSSRGARHRKHSGEKQPREADTPGSGMAIFAGALIDGIPESIVIGLSLLGGTGVSVPTVAAIFLSNLPEGLATSSGMKQAGRSRLFIIGLHTSVVVISALAAVVGYALFDGVSKEIVAAITAVAAGGILAMLADTMMPEAFAEARDFTGLVTAFGFLTAFVLQKLA